MSFATINVPNEYGYVLLTCIVGPFISHQIMSVTIMKARKKLDVQYPNLYAVPSVHKNADEFNRIQRGHQNMFETLSFFVPAALFGGLKHPIACAVFGVMYSLGSYLYMSGYSNIQLDIKMARHLRGGPIRYIGIFGALGSTISLAGTIIGWWS